MGAKFHNNRLIIEFDLLFIPPTLLTLTMNVNDLMIMMIDGSRTQSTVSRLGLDYK